MRKIKRRKKTTDQNVREIIKKRKKQKVRVEFLNSGCTTLNLALSGKGKEGGWARGRIANIVGDGSSGKTLLALELAFWCFQHIKSMKSQIFPRVKKLIIVYNNCEGPMDFPIEEMYGEEFVKFVRWECSKTVEQMGRDYGRRLNSLKKGWFLLYIVDSWDAIGSIAGHKRFDKSVKDDEEIKNSYALEKQKYASMFFENLSGKMEHNKFDSTLVIISQVRTKIGVTFGKKTYRAGGKALDFYTHQVAWIREIEKLRKTKRKKKRVYGIKSEVKVERSKVAKPFRESDFTILYDYGLDDISSMVDFLWDKKVIRFQGKKFESRAAFIKSIEKGNKEDELIKKTEQEWNKVEEAFTKEVRKRKARY